MGEAMAAALAKGQLVGEHPGQTLGDMRQTQLNDGDVSISFETDIHDDLAEVYD
jgi:hypothetical protein